MNLICPCCREAPTPEREGGRCRYVCGCGSFTPWRDSREEADKDWIGHVESWNRYEVREMWEIVYYAKG